MMDMKISRRDASAGGDRPYHLPVGPCLQAVDS